MVGTIRIIKGEFICPKCCTTYNQVVRLTIDSGICTGCRQATDIPNHIPEKQHEKWWRSYKWQKI